MNPTENELSTITDSTIVLLDNPGGEPISVQLYKVPLRRMQELGKVWTNFPGEAALYARKDETWANGLTEENLLTVVEGGRRINFPLFQRWAKLMADSIQAMTGNKGMERLVAQAAAQQRSPGAESPASPK